MIRITTTGLFAACGLVALFSVEAAAQAPTLSATANGPSVTITWTQVPGALGYEIQAALAGTSYVATVPLPASTTRIVVTAPLATYQLRVRAFGVGLVGPWSNIETLTVSAAPSPPACSPPAAPVVSATVQGLGVTLNWPAVPGAAGYQLQWSRFSGGTELVELTAGTSQTKNIGVAGTFFARVVALSACGNAASPEVAFTLPAAGSPPAPGPTPGGGNRSPNPGPGQLLPPPTYGDAVVMDVYRRYPGDFANSCGNNVWLFRVVNALRQRDTRWGLNWKRGQRGSLSQDIVTFNPTDRPDNGEAQIYLFDVIGSHCEGPRPTFNNVTDATWSAGAQGLCGAGNTWCAKWTLDPYLTAGFPADPR